MRNGVSPHVKLQAHTRKSLEFLGEVADTELALVGLQSLNGLSNVIDCRRVSEASTRLVCPRTNSRNSSLEIMDIESPRTRSQSKST